MSLLATAVTTAVVSGTAGSMILKYSKSEYEAKINKLDGYMKLLDQHLDTLETLKGRINEFWNDEQATNYVTVLTTQIIKLRDARNNAENLKITWQEASDDMAGAKEKISGIIDTAKAVLGQLGD